MTGVPSYELTTGMINLIAEIAELVAKTTLKMGQQPDHKLRKTYRIRTIHSSTAIEGNTLTLAETTGVIEGKQVVAPKQEILEIRNAFAAYERIESLDPTSVDDLLAAHGIMMAGLSQDAGTLRSHDVGVFAGPLLIHKGVDPSEVPTLVAELLSWLQTAGEHPLIKGCAFHGAFELIHPFSDGNGRTGRLWHSLINRRWRPVLAWAPVESMVQAHQMEYYQVLGFSESGDLTLFIEFMLEMLRDALLEMRGNSIVENVPPSTPQVPPKYDYLVVALMEALGQESLSVIELMDRLELSDRKHFRQAYLRPAIEAGLIDPTIPNKPNSPRQKYRRCDSRV